MNTEDDEAFVPERTDCEFAVWMLREPLRQRFEKLLKDKYPDPGKFATAMLDFLLEPEVNSLLPDLYRPKARVLPPAQQVYFAKLGSLVKIGISANPKNRVTSIGAALVATEPGGRDREMALHLRFAEARERMEWFREHDELTAYVEALPTFTGWPS